MRFEDLIEFLESGMRMSHIYQPLLIRSLIDSGGIATIRQLALAFLVQDESELLYYEKRIKEMPLKVLRKHGVVSYEKGLVSLRVPKLTFQQKAQVKMLCDQKLQDFLLKRGLGTWDYRMLEADPVPDSLRFRVLQESGGRCALCGATKKDRPLDVDHIKPRSRGGLNVYENLQVLCSKCNRSKGNQDDTDFRGEAADGPDNSCFFCKALSSGRAIDELGTAFVIKDGYPVTECHLLIIPKRHVSDYYELFKTERDDMESLVRIHRKMIQKRDATVTGFNVGVNIGESAGQSIFHTHMHLIPRRNGDTPHPKGGVRGVIPGKRGY